jgi:glutathione S-transferase
MERFASPADQRGWREIVILGHPKRLRRRAASMAQFATRLGGCACPSVGLFLREVSDWGSRVRRMEKHHARSLVMKLYEFGPTRSIRARWMLQELGIDFEAITVDPKNGDLLKPEFKRINPAAKLPALVDGDLVLTESVAIVLYLAEKVPGCAFMPTDLQQRAQLYRWLLFTVTELEQPLSRIAKNENLYSEDERSAGDVVIASREFKQMAAILEAHMRGRNFVVSDHVTLCDFVLAYTLDWGNERRLLGECPQLLAYMERMYQRPHAAPRIAATLASLTRTA